MSNINNKKIAFVASIFWMHAAFNYELIKMLKEKGYDLYVYGKKDRGWDAIKQLGVNCIDWDVTRFPFTPKNIKGFLFLYNEFKEKKFALIHSHTPVGGVLSRIATLFNVNSKSLYTAHGFHFFKNAPLHYWFLYFPMEFILSFLSDGIITMNKYDEMMAKKYLVGCKKIFYIPGVGVDLDKFNRDQIKNIEIKNLNLETDTFNIVYIAEFIERKNHRQMIDSLSMLFQNSHKYDKIRCYFLGEGENMNQIKVYVEQKKLGDKIIFLGHRKDLNLVLSRMNLSILLSRHEGLSLALIESIATGLPLISTNVRGNADLVRHGVNGYLVEFGDVNSTAEAIRKLFDSNNLLSDMSFQCLKIRDFYSSNKVVERMKNIYLLYDIV
jgi:glycosyltransferase involved in cell wall biosynthesis